MERTKLEHLAWEVMRHVKQGQQYDQGDIMNWLNVNIRNKGAMYDPLYLIKEVTGKEFTAKYYIENTKEKCSKLYGF